MSTERHLVLTAESAELRCQLGPTAWVVLEELLLASTGNGDACRASVSVRSLASRLGLAKDTVARALIRLRRDPEIWRKCTYPSGSTVTIGALRRARRGGDWDEREERRLIVDELHERCLTVGNAVTLDGHNGPRCQAVPLTAEQTRTELLDLIGMADTGVVDEDPLHGASSLATRRVLAQRLPKAGQEQVEHLGRGERDHFGQPGNLGVNIRNRWGLERHVKNDVVVHALNHRMPSGSWWGGWGSNPRPGDYEVIGR